MEVVTIDGQEFVKASVAARQAGYTSDYVGQLARTSAIPARLIGRTWYVDTDALRTHRVEKKRFAREKAREQVKKAIAEKKANDAPLKALQGSGTRIIRMPVYETDDKDLIPKIEKTPHIPHVETVAVSADEKKVEGEYRPLTVTISESEHVQTGNSENVIEKRLPIQRAAKRHRQVIAPRKREPLLPASVTGKTLSVPALLKKSELVYKKNEKVPISGKKRRKRGISLIFFILSIPLAIFLATFEIHTVGEAADEGVPEIRTEFVINIGIFKDIASELRHL